MKNIILILFLLMQPLLLSANCDTIKEIKIEVFTTRSKLKATKFGLSVNYQQNYYKRISIGELLNLGDGKTYENVNTEVFTLKLNQKICLEDFNKANPKVQFIINSDAQETWEFNCQVTITTSDNKTYTYNAADKIKFKDYTNNFIDLPLSSINTIALTESNTIALTESNTEGNAKKSDPGYKFMYLNAVDFDFINNNAGYVGHLNMYKRPYKKWGFNAGLMKINYTNNDSVVSYSYNNIRTSPVNPPGADTTYINQYNRFSQKVKATSFSIYMQALRTLSKDANYHIYAHGHFELLISNYKITTNISTIAQDTITVPVENIPATLTNSLSSSVTTSQNLLNGYMGVGLTFDLNISKKSSLFFQPTVGYTTNYPQPASVNDSNFYYIDTSRGWTGFYLIRSYYRNELENAEIIIGTDIRGLLPQYAPYYSVYAGININVEGLANLIK